MIEIRVIDNGPMCRPDFQYRIKNQISPGCIKPLGWKEWGDWETAEYVKVEYIKNA